MTRQRVLLICTGDGARTPRTVRFSRLFREAGYEVFVASHAKGGPGFFELDAPPRPNGFFGKRLRRYSYFSVFLPNIGSLRDRIHAYRYRQRPLKDLLQNESFDLILVQDFPFLPTVLQHKGAAKVMFDAREYYPTQNEESSVFRRFEKPERERIFSKWLPELDAMIATSQGHADAFREATGVDATIILSASRRHSLEPTPPEPGKVRLVHHGVTNLNRQLTKYIDLLDILDDRFTLDFYLVAKDELRIQSLKDYASANPRIRFHDPVPFDNIISTVHQYDVGLAYFEPTTFNLLHTVPNKIFEYVQARLAVAIGPSPGMHDVLKPHGCAIVADRFAIESLAAKLAALTDETLLALKEQADLAADHLTAEIEGQKLLDLVEEIMGVPADEAKAVE